MGKSASKFAERINDGGEENNGGVEMSTGTGGGALNSLTSLWSTSTEKDNTCVQWGLVSAMSKSDKWTSELYKFVRTHAFCTSLGVKHHLSLSQPPL